MKRTISDRLFKFIEHGCEIKGAQVEFYEIINHPKIKTFLCYSHFTCAVESLSANPNNIYAKAIIQKYLEKFPEYSKGIFGSGIFVHIWTPQNISVILENGVKPLPGYTDLFILLKIYFTITIYKFVDISNMFDILFDYYRKENYNFCYSEIKDFMENIRTSSNTTMENHISKFKVNVLDLLEDKYKGDFIDIETMADTICDANSINTLTRKILLFFKENNIEIKDSPNRYYMLNARDKVEYICNYE